MTKKLDKDAWIRDAIRKRYIIPQRDGSCLRCNKADKDGKLLSDKYHKITLQTHKPTGRVYFTMTWRGIEKSVLINRAVAWMYLPNPDNLPQVDHKDGVKSNNAVSNLEWVTGSENERRAHATGLKTGRGSSNSNAKLTAAQVLDIRSRPDPSPDRLAAEFGVSRSTIIGILNRKTWSHL